MEADQHAPIVAANTKFAIDLYHQIREKPGNIFVSPTSISAALALCFLGAKGDTVEEMEQTMNIRGIDDVNERFGNFLSTLKSSSGDYQLNIANRLYGAEKYSFFEEYLKQSLKLFGADLERLNFSDEAKSRSVINTWVEEKTVGKIKDLIPPGALDHLTKLVLVNAIYFKGNWDKKFNVKSTSKRKFNVAENESKDVDMMFQDEKFPFWYDVDTGCQVLEMPYVNKDLSMFILLPTTRGGLADIEPHLSVEFVNKLTKSVRDMKIMVSLPKFKFEQTTELNDVLENMGMKKLFTEGQADLSGMDGTRELFVSRAIHKAFVEVNEEGTEAAAATGIMVASYCMPPEFSANRPFLFFIRDNRTRALLFLGRVNDPTL